MEAYGGSILGQVGQLDNGTFDLVENKGNAPFYG
jgi:hypothetical protein